MTKDRPRSGPAGLCLLVALAMLAGPAAARNSFLVAPGRVDFDLSRPNTQSFILTNNGDGDIRLSIEPVYFPVASKSLAAGEPLRPEAAGADDMRGFVRVSPRALALAPGQRRDIRISVRPPADLTPGDYRAHLLVRMREPAMTVEQGAEDGGRSIGMRLDIKMETGVAVYGHRGAREPRLELSCARDVDGQLVATVTNPTVWRFEGPLTVHDADAPADGAPLATQVINSLRETRRAVTFSWQPPHNGPFELRWAATNTGGAHRGRASCDLGS